MTWYPEVMPERQQRMLRVAVSDIGHLLMSLIYFDDAEAELMPEMLWDIGWDEIKRTIEGWISDFVERSSTI